MRRALVPLAALTFGDALIRGWLVVAMALLLVAMVLAVRLQWRVSKKVVSFTIPPVVPDPEAVERGLYGNDNAASDVYVGLMQDGEPTGQRKRARVLLDGSVRFVRPVYLPLPPRGYDEVGVWAEDASWNAPPLVRLSPWLCATETDDGNVAVANITA